MLFADRFTGFSPLDRKEVGLQFVFPQRSCSRRRCRRLWRFYRLAGEVTGRRFAVLRSAGWPQVLDQPMRVLISTI